MTRVSTIRTTVNKINNAWLHKAHNHPSHQTNFWKIHFLIDKWNLGPHTGGRMNMKGIIVVPKWLVLDIHGVRSSRLPSVSGKSCNYMNTCTSEAQRPDSVAHYAMTAGREQLTRCPWARSRTSVHPHRLDATGRGWRGTSRSPRARHNFTGLFQSKSDPFFLFNILGSFTKPLSLHILFINNI